MSMRIASIIFEKNDAFLSVSLCLDLLPILTSIWVDNQNASSALALGK
jgi:hypothetical protein